MKPGARTRSVPSTSVVPRSGTRPSAMMRSPSTARSPRTASRPVPSPNLMAAALARRSTEAMLLVLGNSIALYNPPVRVAEEFAMLDVMSGGRLIAGFPVGTSMDTNYCYGVNPATLRERYREAHDLIIKAWATREPFPWNGKYTKLRYVNLWPRPIQQPHPPIWIPGLGP